MAEPHNLQRFVTAQDGVYAHVLAELGQCSKTSHWMWFVFPQIAGLGRSPMAQEYAISGLDEARAYLAHPVLGARLRECAALMLACAGSAEDVLGGIDAVKLRSCMTLFLRAAPSEEVFQAVLDRFYEGKADSETDARL